MRIRYAIVFAAALVLAPALASLTFADAGYRVSLDGSQEVPANASEGLGFGTLIVDNAQTHVTYNLSYSGLTSDRTAQHIHGPAPVGVNAGVLVGLDGTGVMIGTISGVATINATIAGYIAAGQAYVNIHTLYFPGGEIRGQIMPDATPTRPTSWGRIKKLYR